MPTPTIRVLCADDHRLMREGIARIVGVQRDMTVVAQASDGEQAVAQFLQHRPDVTLMDLEMPKMNGILAIQAIRNHQPQARIVVLTMRERAARVRGRIEITSSPGRGTTIETSVPVLVE